MSSYEVTQEEMCKPSRPGNVVMPNQRNFSAHMETCQKFGGKTTVVRDMETQTTLGKIVESHEPCVEISKEGGEITQSVKL